MILTHKWSKEAVKKKTLNENMNIHFFDLTVKLYAFDFNTHDVSIYVLNLVVGVHKCGENVSWSETSNNFLLFFLYN